MARATRVLLDLTLGTTRDCLKETVAKQKWIPKKNNFAKPLHNLDADLASSKAIKHKVATAWQYAKTEVAPPMTLGFFHGPVGEKLEQAVSKAADSFIAGLDGKIKDMDAEEARKIKEKENEIKAAQDRAKAEVLKKEAERKRIEAEKAKTAVEKPKEESKETKKDKDNEKKKEPPKKDGKKK